MNEYPGFVTEQVKVSELLPSHIGRILVTHDGGNWDGTGWFPITGFAWFEGDVWVHTAVGPKRYAEHAQLELVETTPGGFSHG